MPMICPGYPPYQWNKYKPESTKEYYDSMQKYWQWNKCKLMQSDVTVKPGALCPINRNTTGISFCVPSFAWTSDFGIRPGCLPLGSNHDRVMLTSRSQVAHHAELLAENDRLDKLNEVTLEVPGDM